MSRSLIFRQLFEHLSSTYTYILACNATKEAVIIDPVLETVDRDAKIITEMGLKLRYAANTHMHADHVTGTGELRRRYFPEVKTVIAKASGANADLHIVHEDTISFGGKELQVRATPGHTDGCVSYVLHQDRMVFTGDAVLIRGCGRTDFQQGDAGRLYDNVHREILSLPDDYLLYPAHDYKGVMASTVGEEKAHNPRLTQTKEKFKEIMDNLNLAYPKQIDKSLPANKVCGVFELMDEKTLRMVRGETLQNDPSIPI